MKWFEGNIAQAVAKSKTDGCIFVVYIEGKDDNSKKISKFLENESIRSQLESENFVPIKVEGGSPTYMQFASIYQVVPVPSIFFIGKSGTPLEIATGILNSEEELSNIINKVLTTCGKKSVSIASVTTTSFIAAEQQAATTSSAATSPLSKESPAAAATTSTKNEDEEIVCEGDVCYKRKKEPKSEPQPEVATLATANSKDVEETKKTVKAESEANAEADAEARLEETRKRLEQMRRERVEEEKKQEKERELRRRREGKEMQSLQEWQKEHELKELKENIKRERLEEQAARERIRAQIAADRVERARKFAPESTLQTEPNTSVNNSNDVTVPSVSNADTARLQFRLSNGSTKTNTFASQDTLLVVRAYIKSDLLPGTGIKDYILATTYPKREFTSEHDVQTLLELGLAPSAVMLVIGKEGNTPVALIKRSGGIVNLLTTIFLTLMSPVFAVFGYFRSMVTRRDGNGAAAVGAQKRANEEQGAQHDAAKRRNLDRLLGGSSGPSTSNSNNSGGAAADNFESNVHKRYAGGSNIHRLRDNHNDSDDENATWNGNSTQQQ